MKGSVPPKIYRTTWQWHCWFNTIALFKITCLLSLSFGPFTSQCATLLWRSEVLQSLLETCLWEEQLDFNHMVLKHMDTRLRLFCMRQQWNRSIGPCSAIFPNAGVSKTVYYWMELPHNIYHILKFFIRDWTPERRLTRLYSMLHCGACSRVRSRQSQSSVRHIFHSLSRGWDPSHLFRVLNGARSHWRTRGSL